MKHNEFCPHCNGGGSDKDNVSCPYCKGTGRQGDCFPGDSKVMTPFGWRNICELKEDDIVLSYDRDGSLSQRRVMRKNSYSNSSSIVNVVSHNDSLSFSATKSHSIKTARGWILVNKLVAGDKIVSLDDKGRISNHTLKKVEESNRHEPVFNLIIEGNFNFIVKGCVAHSFSYFRILRMLYHTVRNALKPSTRKKDLTHKPPLSE